MAKVLFIFLVLVLIACGPANPTPEASQPSTLTAERTNTALIPATGISAMPAGQSDGPSTPVQDPTGSPESQAALAPEAMGVVFSTLIGGPQEDTIRDVAVDASGNIYVTGGTASGNFPTTQGAADTSHNGSMDVFVTKFDPQGKLVWSTLLGGPNYDRAYAIELDGQGGVYVGGRAGPGFPTTSGVIQPAFGGDANPMDLYGNQDGFVARISPDGSRVDWATYFGGNDRGFIRDIDVDAGGQVYLALTAVSKPVPHITAGAFQSSLSGGEDGVIAKLAAGGGRVLWATYLGAADNNPSNFDVATPTIQIDGSGNTYVLGATNSGQMPTSGNAFDRSLGGNLDLHLAKFSSDGKFVFGVYLGGSGGEFIETHGIAIDNQGNPIVVGSTTSNDFPTTAGVLQPVYGGAGGDSTGRRSNYPGDAFVAKISSDGSRLIASSYLGGSFGDGPEGVGVDAQNNIYVGGATFSDDFPLSSDAFQRTNGGGGDFFAVKLSPDLSSLLYGTYIGGGGEDFGRSLAVDPAGNIYAAGEASSRNWPAQQAFQATPGGGRDGALSRFSSGGASTPPPGGGNQPPVVDAGPDVFTDAQTIQLNGAATDDGQPSAPNSLVVKWAKVDGPGKVTFQSATSLHTQATFSQPGFYRLSLTASDGQLTSSDEVVVGYRLEVILTERLYIPMLRDAH